MEQLHDAHEGTGPDKVGFKFPPPLFEGDLFLTRTDKPRLRVIKKKKIRDGRRGCALTFRPVAQEVKTREAPPPNPTWRDLPQLEFVLPPPTFFPHILKYTQ